MYNSMAASVAASVLNLKKESIRESLQDFQSLEHRLEYVTKIGGVKYINDSKATNVNSTWYALEHLQGPIVWIAGGVDKGNDYTHLVDLVKEKVTTIICIGKDNRNIHAAFGSKVDLIVNMESMSEAVQMSQHLVGDQGTVLLSPACASFDMFSNYEERGRSFKSAVKAL